MGDLGRVLRSENFQNIFSIWGNLRRGEESREEGWGGRRLRRVYHI